LTPFFFRVENWYHGILFILFLRWEFPLRNLTNNQESCILEIRLTFLGVHHG
jgi:hypothetical protein